MFKIYSFINFILIISVVISYKNMLLTSFKFFIIRLLLLAVLLSSSVVYGQEIKSFLGRKITTVIESKGSGGAPIVLGAGGDHKTDNQPGPPSSTTAGKYSWVTTFGQEKNGQVEVSKTLKRIVYISDNPFRPIKYDSDNTFESSDEGEKAVKAYVNVLNKPSVKNISYNSSTALNSYLNMSKTDTIWNRSLPIYDTTLYWNCLLFTPAAHKKLEKNLSWDTEVQLKDKTVKNTYNIEDLNPDNIIVKITSKSVYKNKRQTNNLTGLPAGLSMGLTEKATNFEGTLLIDPKTLFVKSATFQVVKISELAFNGDVAEQKGISDITITNTISK